jgi:hypothetical protein
MNARAWIASISGATVLAALSIVTVAVPAADAAPPVQVPVGTLSLALGAVDQFSFDKGTTSTSDDITQPIGNLPGKCALTPLSGPLANWSSTGGVPTFYNNSIGVAAPSGSGSTGRECGRVSKTPAETLTLSLPRTPGGAYDSIFGQAYANAASLEVEVKGDAVIKADLSLNGVPTGTYYLRDGDEYYKTTPPALPNTSSCAAVSRSYGDDDGERDNCTWVITGAKFDSITFSVLRGAFSLEGGSDCRSTAVRTSTFSLVVDADGTVACGQTITPSTVTEGSISDVVITSLENGLASDGTCVGIPFTLTADGGSTTFHKPATTQGSAQFTLDLTRTVPASSGIDPLTVDWEDGTPVYDLPWCKTGLKTGSTFNYSVLTVDDDASSATDGIQYACQFGLDPTFNEGDSTLTIVDSVYFTGDIKFTTR